MSKYAKLKDSWLLRGWSDAKWVLVNWTNGHQIQLEPQAFYVAECCDGTTNFASVAFLPNHRAVLDKLIGLGVVIECAKGESIAAVQRYRVANAPRLKGVHWAITGRCNLNCRHCYMDAPTGRYGEPSFATVLRIIDELEMANVHLVSLTGGEPFVRPDVLDIASRLVSKRIGIREIYTSGLLVTTQSLQAINRLGIQPVFQISFDGVGTHDRMRGRLGIEGMVINAIGQVRAAGFNVVIATSIDKINGECLSATYELLKRLNIQCWRIAPPQRIGAWRTCGTQLSLDEQVQLYEAIVKRWLEDHKPFAIQLGNCFHWSDTDHPATSAASIRQLILDAYDCYACREMPYLMPDGALLPCPGYTGSGIHTCMPNVIRDGFVNALRDPLLRAILDINKRDLLNRNSECLQCEFLNECGMGCRASAYVETNNLMAKDPLACEVTRKQYVARFSAIAHGSVPARPASPGNYTDVLV